MATQTIQVVDTENITNAKLTTIKTAPSVGHAPKRAEHQIPECSSLEALLEREKAHMAGAFRIFAKLGFADGASGHISLRDPTEPSTFWINPYAKHFGTMTVSDLIHVDENGTALSPTPHKVNTAGFVIHSKLHQARPDINAACHCHSPYSRAWSVFGKPLEMITQDACMFYDDLSVYRSFGGAVFAEEEGERLAAALGPTNKNIILQSHGVLTAGATVAEAAAYFIALERACQTQLLAEAALRQGLEKCYVGDEEAKYTKEGTAMGAAMYMQFVPEYELLLKETGGDFLE